VNKEPTMQRLLATAIAVTAACRLDPLVEDDPGASAHVLPAGANVPDVITNADLINQLSLNDGLDTKALQTAGNIILRGTGQSDGMEVRYWAFGAATRAPSPLYRFGTVDTGGAFHANDHLPLADAMPGEYSYSPLHAIHHVIVTERYAGELITTTSALADAIQLGLVEAPVATHTFVDSPIVRPGLTLDVDDAPGGGHVAIPPTKLYAHGYVMEAFQLGNLFGPLPNPKGLLPTSDVSYLRDRRGPIYDATRPIFQATIPASAEAAAAAYTPLSVIVDVDLTADNAGTITRDSELFQRNPSGGIDMVTDNVAHFAATSSLVLQLQFKKGMP
jgi:hypothetical protein